MSRHGSDTLFLLATVALGGVAVGLVAGCAENQSARSDAGVPGDAPLDAPLDGDPSCRDGLVAWYRFDESTGPLIDVCGRHDGVIEGSGVSRGMRGHIGAAIEFTGTDGRAVIPASAELDFSTGGTIELWLQVTDRATPGDIASRGTGNLDDNVVLSTDCGNVLAIHTRANVGGSVVATGCAALPVDGWAHVAVVNNGSQAQVFINGTLNAMSSGGFLGALPHDLYLGRRSDGTFPLEGSLDELTWWTVARTAEQICRDAGRVWTASSCVLNAVPSVDPSPVR